MGPAKSKGVFQCIFWYNLYFVNFLLLTFDIPVQIYIKQNQKTTRLKHIEELNKQRGETTLRYNIRIIAYLLNVGPWNRLGLSM